MIFRKLLCHLYIYNLHSGSLNPHSNVILATTVSYFAAKTSQCSTQSYQKCSDARESFKKLASRTGKGHFVRDGHTDARKSGEKLASRKLRHRRHITGGLRTERGWREGGERMEGDGGRIKEG